jgi:hypothetical protein
VYENIVTFISIEAKRKNAKRNCRETNNLKQNGSKHLVFFVWFPGEAKNIMCTKGKKAKKLISFFDGKGSNTVPVSRLSLGEKIGLKGNRRGAL